MPKKDKNIRKRELIDNEENLIYNKKLKLSNNKKIAKIFEAVKSLKNNKNEIIKKKKDNKTEANKAKKIPEPKNIPNNSINNDEQNVSNLEKNDSNLENDITLIENEPNENNNDNGNNDENENEIIINESIDNETLIEQEHIDNNVEVEKNIIEIKEIENSNFKNEIDNTKNEEISKKDNDNVENEEKPKNDNDNIENEEKLKKDNDNVENEEKLKKDKDNVKNEEKLKKDNGNVKNEEKLKKDNDNVENEEQPIKENIKNNKKPEDNNKLKETYSPPTRKSRRLLEKKMEVVTIEVPDTPLSKKSTEEISEADSEIKTKSKNDSITKKTNHSINRRKRMTADRDLITHQNIEDTENLGKKNPLEIIKKVIGNSDEEVELVEGAQLPVLINPEINRMKYQLGEIIIIKNINENSKESDNNEEVETSASVNEVKEDKDNKKRKRKLKKFKNKKEKSLNNNDININQSGECINHGNKNKSENEDTNKNNKNNIENQRLYYIHFINQDKRLDSWRKEEDLWTKKKYPEISNDPSETTTSTTPYLYIPDDKTKLTRSMKRKYGIISESLQSLSEIDPKLAALEKEREEITKVKNIEKVQFGNYLLNSWYFSPYPNEYKNENILYICDHCMKYMKYESTLIRHRKECAMVHPPGILVYEKDNLRVYEIDGKKEKLYCQNFCLLSKLFLDHKTVYYDIEPFLFYVLTKKTIENGEEVDYVMGYFSKEKRSFDDYNLACILVLPPYQRKGYGHFLIEFSYELSKRENKIGSPEKPLSDLGLVGYRTYWQSVLLRIIKNNPKMNFTLRELSLLTSIRHEDIVSTLGSMNMLKYWKGEHSLCVTHKMVEEFLSEHQNIKLEPMVDAALIHDTYISEPIVTKKKYIDLTN